MTDKIKEFRKVLPVPMNEALKLLKDNDGDVEKCIYLFKAKSIKEICGYTGCDETMTIKYYEEEKYDFNRTISAIQNELYDISYVPIEGVSAEGIRSVLYWINLIGEHDLASSLDYERLDLALETMWQIPEMKEIADIISRINKVKNSIFEGYKDSDPLEDFVRRHKELDDNPDFQRAYGLINLRTTIIKEILLRHLRNLVK